MLIYGAGGHSKVVVDCLYSQNINIDGFFDDNLKEKPFENFDFFGHYQPTILPEQSLVIAIGNNQIRKEVSQKITHQIGKAIHSHSCISPSAHTEEGLMIFPFAVLQAHTHICKHVILNTHAVIEHDCNIGNFVHIAPNSVLGGGVSVGEGTLIGMSATILPNISIGKWCVIGAGAVVTQNIPDFCVAYGVPAKIKKNLII
ncbi:MAG: acetyltransferase [Cytophagales bacterium]|nr:MAG: acetyltransferase [Cytophagales bacterium]TAH28718.1 MAG: acetyltransferase [Cytophagales bacterium]